jgi:hypothetical protein
MGSEIIFPIAAFFLCELVAFFLFGLVYLWAFRFRITSARWRMALRGILNFFALLLVVPSVMCLFAGPFWIFGALFGDIEPFSDRILMMVVALVFGGIIAAGWWWLFRAHRKLDQSLQP